MRAQSQIEGGLGERERWKFGRNVSTLSLAGRKVVQEGLHSRHPDLTKLFN